MLTVREDHRERLDACLERLVRLQGSDPGFYVLALHAFLEGFLRDLFPPPTKEEDSFYWLLDSFRDYLVTRANRFLPGLETLGSSRASTSSRTASVTASSPRRWMRRIPLLTT